MKAEWAYSSFILHPSSFFSHGGENRRDDDFPPTVRGPPRFLQQIAEQVLVFHEDFRDFIEDGGVLQRLEQRLERRTIGDVIEGEDGRLLHVRVGILERAVERGERGLVAAQRNRGRGGGADAPVVV